MNERVSIGTTCCRKDRGSISENRASPAAGRAELGGFWRERRGELSGVFCLGRL